MIVQIRTEGFTLIELVVSITVASIVVGIMCAFVGAPIDMYMSQSRRAGMDDAADDIWRNMQRDLAPAIPYSVRAQKNGTVVVLEAMPATTWARYHPNGSMGNNAAKELAAPGLTDTDFDVVGSTAMNLSPSLSVTILHDNTSNPYAVTSATNFLGVQQATPDPLNPGEVHILMSSFLFALRSPNNRVYFSTYPVTYLCDLRAQTMRRYTRYKPTPSQNSVNTAAKLTALNATSTLIATGVSDCAFGVSGPLANGGQLVTTHVTLMASANSGAESAHSFHELYVENIP
jgi:prepilin-type N-terminal cleavage/methylation domain-containing protein